MTTSGRAAPADDTGQLPDTMAAVAAAIGDKEPVVAAWLAMRALVLDHDRRKEVSDTLGMSFVRVKALRRLAELADSAALPLRRLSAYLATDPPYTTIVIDDLEARGLVRRAVDPDDRRAKTVTATPAGREAAAQADEILGEPPPSLLALDPADAAELARILSSLLP